MIEFTNHNIRLDDGTYTMPSELPMEQRPITIATKRMLETVFPGDKNHIRLVDLGCLEGGYAVEFARMGFDVLGIEVRDNNIAACNYVKSKVGLPLLKFVKDNAWNLPRYGVFDAVFCCGLLYHFDTPKRFIEMVSGVTKRLLILNTHFSISGTDENEGLKGHWFTEFGDDSSFKNRENMRWSSWDNRLSFWLQRPHLFQAMRNVGFDIILEQFDALGTDIVGRMNNYERNTFIGIKMR
jgi:cyclopropane fatty-acyl-phospholipid synthase-like methyltransferase